MKKITFICMCMLLFTLNGCKKYIDVVPDNVATIQDAFSNRAQALKFLGTCYSYLPNEGSPNADPAIFGGDEFWIYGNSSDISRIPTEIARGFQTVTSPLLNYWDGANLGEPLFRGIRDCNIFTENIHLVRDITDFERTKWLAEVKFLKAYYHFYLLRMYGPIPIVDKNLPISATAEEVRVYRRPIGECVDYIANLLDEAAINLPEKLDNPTTELGRITKPIALGIKARLLVMAASPLFNGNADMASLKNNDGTALFNSTVDPKRWERALSACKDAIALAESQGVALYTFTATPTTGNLSPETSRLLTIQNAVTDKWNPEIIWGSSNSPASGIQHYSQAHLDPTLPSGIVYGFMAPTFRMAELFYTKNGVPINEDVTWDYANRYQLRTATDSEKFYIQKNRETVQLHFDREPRFYADLGFDGGKWYGIGRFNENDQWYIAGKLSEFAGKVQTQRYSVTGYVPKKLVNYQNVMLANGYTASPYPWPIIRLADLYLLYAEAANEHNGPNADAYFYLDKVRERAGLKGVVESWSAFSSNPNKPATKEGLRDIIRQERLIEMAFEGSRFWDIRRWKTAPLLMDNKVIRGWDVDQKTSQEYYKLKILYTQKFGLRDYFWPLSENSILVNRNLVQNIGW